MKLKQLEMALYGLDNQYNFTLNTDQGYESVRSREAILKCHYIHNAIGEYKPTPEFYEALDAYLELRKFIDEAIKSKMQSIHMVIYKEPKFSFEEL